MDTLEFDPNDLTPELLERLTVRARNVGMLRSVPNTTRSAILRGLVEALGDASVGDGVVHVERNQLPGDAAWVLLESADQFVRTGDADTATVVRRLADIIGVPEEPPSWVERPHGTDHVEWPGQLR
jgi:hypothetical protein